jgi:hypothetical protein
MEPAEKSAFAALSSGVDSGAGTLNDAVNIVRRTERHWWPHPKGSGHLGVKLTNTPEQNAVELCRRFKGQGRLKPTDTFTAAQALHRLTDGMPNHSGPPNGPQRPTLAAKWKSSKPGERAAIGAHVLKLRVFCAAWMAEMMAEEVGAGGLAEEVGAGGPAAKRSRTAGPGDFLGAPEPACEKS